MRHGEMTGPAEASTGSGSPAQAKQLHALNVIACALSGSVETSEVLDRAMRSLLDVTGMTIGAVYLHDRERDRLVSRRLVGFHHGLGPLQEHDPASTALPSRAFRSDEALVFDVSYEHLGYGSLTEPERRTIGPEGVRAAIACRIESSSTNYGVVVVCTRDPRRRVDRSDCEFTKVVAGQIGVAIERASLYEDLQRRVLEATTLYEIGRALGSTMETETVLPHALDLASLRFGLAGCEVELHEPLGSRRRFGSPGVPAPDHAGIAMVSAPLVVGDVELGRILAFDTDPPADDTRGRIQAMADLVAMAVWNSRLSEDRARLGVIEERNRLAREIHDGLTQSFYGIQLQLHGARQALESRDADAARRSIDVAIANATAGLGEARRSVRGLREPGIESRSLLDVVQEMVTRHEAATGAECRLISRGTETLTNVEVKAAVARCVQELLHNVQKHAAATAVSVVLAFTPDLLTATVADNGHGFPSGSPHGARDGTRYGLVGVRERMAAVGGRFQCSSTPGQGTVARLVVSCSPPGDNGRGALDPGAVPHITRATNPATPPPAG